jgi:hypothetical protein
MSLFKKKHNVFSKRPKKTLVLDNNFIKRSKNKQAMQIEIQQPQIQLRSIQPRPIQPRPIQQPQIQQQQVQQQQVQSLKIIESLPQVQVFTLVINGNHIEFTELCGVIVTYQLRNYFIKLLNYVSTNNKIEENNIYWYVYALLHEHITFNEFIEEASKILCMVFNEKTKLNLYYDFQLCLATKAAYTLIELSNLLRK